MHLPVRLRDTVNRAHLGQAEGDPATVPASETPSAFMKFQ